MAIDALRDAEVGSAWLKTDRGVTNLTTKQIHDYWIDVEDGRLVSNDDGYRTYAWGGAILSVDHRDNNIRLTIATINPVVREAYRDFVDTHVEPFQNGGVHVLVATNHGVEIKDIGAQGVPLVRDNYDSEVVEAYDVVVRDLSAAEPAGRLVIFDGPPGTGKTYLVRALLSAVQDAMFIVVPPSSVEALTKPELLPTLLDAHTSAAKDGRRIVLVIEDADACLVPRAADNIGLISALLNFGDGLLGQLLDIRIIATTNARRPDIDPALKRPGRLSRHVTIGPLSANQANTRLFTLAPDAARDSRGQRYSRGATLAEVYAAARLEGWTPSDNREIAMPDL